MDEDEEGYEGSLTDCYPLHGARKPGFTWCDKYTGALTPRVNYVYDWDYVDCIECVDGRTKTDDDG